MSRASSAPASRRPPAVRAAWVAQAHPRGPHRPASPRAVRRAAQLILGCRLALVHMALLSTLPGVRPRSGACGQHVTESARYPADTPSPDKFARMSRNTADGIVSLQTWAVPVHAAKEVI